MLLWRHLLLLALATSSVTEAARKRPPSMQPPPPLAPLPSTTALPFPVHALQGIDRRISLTLSDAGPELLRAASAQMNILQAMVTISLLNQDADFPMRVDYVGPGTEDVVVSIYSQSQKTMTNRKVLWALSLIGNAMAMDPEVGYRSRTFLLGWEKKKIGMIQLYRKEESPRFAGKGDASLSMSDPKNAAAFVDNAYANNANLRPVVTPSGTAGGNPGSGSDLIRDSQDSIGDLVVTNNFIGKASPLSLRELMIPLQKCVLDIAARGPNLNKRFESRVDLFDTDVDIYVDYGDYPDGPKPFWSYEDALLALLLSARMVVRYREFYDLTFTVLKNDEEAGMGMVWKNLGAKAPAGT